MYPGCYVLSLVTSYLLVDDDLLRTVPKMSWQDLAKACKTFGNMTGLSHAAVVYKGTMKDGWRLRLF
jgi:hypothetical protein